ncbi:hypothetical protein INR49_016401 [Caranx melampygus]|nr:hypothetical protein INR49_016401 [Caranx melampygus]
MLRFSSEDPTSMLDDVDLHLRRLRLSVWIMGTTVVTLEDVQALEAKEEQEESILAMLGIIGTFLNLFVIVFVYIYTTL